jgi:ubiquinone/menaquinone biosynthesis C-methylase UbiE
MTTFNEIANEYDAWYNTPLGRFVDEVESKLAFEAIEIKPGMKVLDVGCGTGIYTRRLVDMGCEVTGVDIADKMLDIAREKVPEAKFVNSSVYALPFPHDQFDLIFSMATFEFIHNAKAAYYEMKRVVKPGATIFVGTINGDSLWGELYQSEEFKANTVFKDAHFKSPDDFLMIDTACRVSSGACVYFPPNATEDQLNWESEQKLAATERPGFITTQWQKKTL